MDKEILVLLTEILLTAYRYTECELTKISEELLKDIDEDTVNFAPNYKKATEPTVLPSSLPSLLMNGSTGIAVGMATNIPPHNLTELIDAVCSLIDNPTLSIEEIMEIILKDQTFHQEEALLADQEFHLT